MSSAALSGRTERSIKSKGQQTFAVPRFKNDRNRSTSRCGSETVVAIVSCRDAQRLEVFYNRNQQLKEQNKSLQDAVGLLEER